MLRQSSDWGPLKSRPDALYAWMSSVFRSFWSHPGPLTVPSMRPSTLPLGTGGANCRLRSGGSANGMFRYWATLGKVLLIEPCTVPTVVSTWSVLVLEIGEVATSEIATRRPRARLWMEDMVSNVLRSSNGDFPVFATACSA